MLGHKDRDFKPLTALSLDDLVPADNFYRQVECCLDLGFIRDLVCELYSEMGRPSIEQIREMRGKLGTGGLRNPGILRDKRRWLC